MNAMSDKNLRLIGLETAEMLSILCIADEWLGF
jgi:hypothetical protein